MLSNGDLLSQLLHIYLLLTLRFLFSPDVAVNNWLCNVVKP